MGNRIGKEKIKRFRENDSEKILNSVKFDRIKVETAIQTF